MQIRCPDLKAHKNHAWTYTVTLVCPSLQNYDSLSTLKSMITVHQSLIKSVDYEKT